MSSTRKSETNPEKATYKVDQKVLDKIDEKCSRPGFEVVIRFVVNSTSKELADKHLTNIKSAFSQFNGDLNQLGKTYIMFQKALMFNFLFKCFPLIDFWRWHSVSIFVVRRTRVYFSFPEQAVETPNIEFLKAKRAQAPANMPSDGIFIGYSKYRGVRVPVFIGENDRRRHVYIDWKTGVVNTAFGSMRAGYSKRERASVS